MHTKCWKIPIQLNSNNHGHESELFFTAFSLSLSFLNSKFCFVPLALSRIVQAKKYSHNLRHAMAAAINVSHRRSHIPHSNTHIEIIARIISFRIGGFQHFCSEPMDAIRGHNHTSIRFGLHTHDFSRFRSENTCAVQVTCMRIRNSRSYSAIKSTFTDSTDTWIIHSYLFTSVSLSCSLSLLPISRSLLVSLWVITAMNHYRCDDAIEKNSEWFSPIYWMERDAHSKPWASTKR